MERIELLKKDTIDQIAAGEVVEMAEQPGQAARRVAEAEHAPPFCEPPVSKETRLNRRKAPRA